MGVETRWGRRRSDDQAYPKTRGKENLPKGLKVVPGSRRHRAKVEDKTHISVDEAKWLKIGTVLEHKTLKNADGTPQRWRINGRVKRWKREPDRIEIPIKRGLKEYDYVTNENLYMFRAQHNPCPTKRMK